jgi:hypothetical protein
MLIQDFNLYTQATRSPFLDIGGGENILLRDVGISLFCTSGAKSGQWPPPDQQDGPVISDDRIAPGSASKAPGIEWSGVDVTDTVGAGAVEFVHGPTDADSPCSTALQSMCSVDVARSHSTFDMDSCAVCAGRHQHELRVAGCSHQDIQTYCSSAPPLAFVTIRAVSGSSKFFGLPLDGIFGNADGMSLLLVNAATAGRVDLYQASTEHSAHNPQTLIVDSTNVHFHSWKYESSLSGDKSKTSNSSLVWIRDSSKISTFGGSGYYRTYLGAPMIVLKGETSDVVLMGMEREWAYNEPKLTEWLCDEARGVTLDGHLALLYYMDRN